MTHILIAANGTLDSDVITPRVEAFSPELTIGADGGTRHLMALGITPDLVIGDFDSLDDATLTTLREQGVRVEAHPAEKDETDLELALLAAAAYEDATIVVIGATGERLDMTLANLLLLSHEALLPLHIEMWKGVQTLRLLNPPGGAFTGEPGDTLSLIPLKETIKHITTRGLKYALNNGTLTFGPARGVSNVMTDDESAVAFETGLLAVIHTPGRA